MQGAADTYPVAEVMSVTKIKQANWGLFILGGHKEALLLLLFYLFWNRLKHIIRLVKGLQ